MRVMAKLMGILVLTTLVASGCGGSGSDAITGTNPVPDATKLTIEGLITDDPIVNARVMFNVGGQEFTGAVPTGSQGEFSVEIESQSADALVVGNAFDEAHGVYLSAVLGTFSGYRDQARNSVVNSVKITNITTAQQVLAERLALDGQIGSYDEFTQLLPQIDATELLELSALIKTVVEGINGSVLPSGFGNTLDLARAIADGSSTFAADLALQSPGTLEFALNKLLTDGHATVDFTATNAAGVYASVSDHYVYAIFDNGSALVEYFDDNAMVSTPSWNITEDGKLRINFFGFDRDSDSLTLLGSAENSLHIVTDLAGLSSASVDRIASTVTKYEFAAGFDVADIVGTFADPHLSQNNLVFQAGGAGYSVNRNDANTEAPFTWSVATDGRLNIDYTNSFKSEEIVAIQSGDQSRVLSIARFDGQFPTLSVADWGSR